MQFELFSFLVVHLKFVPKMTYHDVP